jgi:hypothetical protein
LQLGWHYSSLFFIKSFTELKTAIRDYSHLITIYCWIVRNGLESKLDVIEKLLKLPCIVEHIFGIWLTNLVASFQAGAEAFRNALWAGRFP